MDSVAMLQQLKEVVGRSTLTEGTFDAWGDPWFESVRLRGIKFPDDVTVVSEQLNKQRQEYKEFWGITHKYTIRYNGVEYELKIKASYPHSLWRGDFPAVVFDDFTAICKAGKETVTIANEVHLRDLRKDLCVSVYHK